MLVNFVQPIYANKETEFEFCIKNGIYFTNIHLRHLLNRVGSTCSSNDANASGYTLSFNFIIFPSFQDPRLQTVKNNCTFHMIWLH